MEIENNAKEDLSFIGMVVIYQGSPDSLKNNREETPKALANPLPLFDNQSISCVSHSSSSLPHRDSAMMNPIPIVSWYNCGHGCPVDWNPDPYKSLEMGALDTTKHVTNLNSGAEFSRISGHKHRTIYCLYPPGSRPGPPPDARPHRIALRAHNLCPPLWIPTKHPDGFRAGDFQSRVARHRYLPQPENRSVDGGNR